LPLLYKAVRWCALDRARSQRRRTDREARSMEPAAEQTALFESKLETEDRRVAIERALASLPPEQREVLVMRIWGELTTQQVADSLGIASGTAASRYRYALEALGRALHPEMVHEF
jgi:RNA polymerase sigma-70 factor (ECF subfamily)